MLRQVLYYGCVCVGYRGVDQVEVWYASPVFNTTQSTFNFSECFQKVVKVLNGCLGHKKTKGHIISSNQLLRRHISGPSWVVLCPTYGTGEDRIGERNSQFHTQSVCVFLHTFNAYKLPVQPSCKIFSVIYLGLQYTFQKSQETFKLLLMMVIMIVFLKS